MKRPEIDEFVQEEGRIYAQNTVTGEEVVFLKSNECNLYMRSMVEEDINPISEIMGLNYKKRKKLRKHLETQDSQYYNYVIQEMFQLEQDGEPKIIAIAKFNGENNMDVIIRLSKCSSQNEFDFAKSMLLKRITSIINDFYIATNTEGIVTINRVG